MNPCPYFHLLLPSLLPPSPSLLPPHSSPLPLTPPPSPSLLPPHSSPLTPLLPPHSSPLTPLLPPHSSPPHSSPPHSSPPHSSPPPGSVDVLWEMTQSLRTSTWMMTISSCLVLEILEEVSVMPCADRASLCLLYHTCPGLP